MWGEVGVPFPKNFVSMIKTIFKRLFRVYAHIYHSHFQMILALGLKKYRLIADWCQECIDRFRARIETD